MNVTLTPELEHIIDQFVVSGRYADANDVVQDAVRRLSEAEERDRYVREALAIAEEQVARGEGIEVTSDYFSDLMRRADEAFAAGIQPKADVCP